MTTKDTRSRRPRKGGRAHRDTLGEAEAGSSESSLLEASDPKVVALLHAVDGDVVSTGAAGAGKSPVHSLLHRLPTPVRDRSTVSPPLEKQQQEQEWQPPPSTAIASAQALPQGVPKGPEPWGLQSPQPQSQQQAGYRDRLRARGQQAMQRGPAPRAAPPGRPQLPTAPPTQAPTLPPMLPQGMAPSPTSSAGHTPQMAAWGSVHEMQMQPQMQQCFATAGFGAQCFGAAGVEMSPIMADPVLHGPMSPESQEVALTFFGCQQGAMTPLEGQQAVSFFGCQPGSQTPGGVGQQPGSYFGYGQQETAMAALCQQGPPAPAVAAQQGATEPTTPVPCSSGSMSQVDDLMARIMNPDASPMDREQIADYLRAAAPPCYDD